MACPGPTEFSTYEATIAQAGDFQAAVVFAMQHDALDVAIDIVIDLTDVGLMWGWLASSHWLDTVVAEAPTPLPKRWAELLAACAYRLENETGDFDVSLQLGNAALEIDRRRACGPRRGEHAGHHARRRRASGPLQPSRGDDGPAP